MDSYSVQKEYKFTIKFYKTAKGEYRYEAKASGDTLQEVEQNMIELRKRIVSAIKTFENG